MNLTERTSYTVGIGVVAGAILGVLAAYLLEFDLGLGMAYGAGTGVVVGASVIAIDDHPNRLALATLAGLVAGLAVGSVAAWSVDLQPLGGAVAGAIVGFSLGAILSLATPRDDRGLLAPERERPQAR